MRPQPCTPSLAPLALRTSKFHAQCSASGSVSQYVCSRAISRQKPLGSCRRGRVWGGWLAGWLPGWVMNGWCVY